MVVTHDKADRAALRRPLLHLDARWRVVDVEALALELPHECGARRVRRRVRGRDLQHIRAVRHGCRVPDENRVPEPPPERAPCGLTFAPVVGVVLQAIVIGILCLPDERLKPLLVGAPPEGWSRRGGARTLRTGLGRLPSIRRVVFESGDLHLPCGEWPLKDNPRRVNCNRDDLRSKIPWEVRRGDGGQNGAFATLCRQCGPPLEVPRIRAADLRPAGVGVRLRPFAPRVVGVCGVARACGHLNPPGTSARPPSECAPAGDGARVADIRLVGAALRGGRGEGKDLPRIARCADDPATRLPQERRDLPGCRPRQQGRASRVPGDPKDLPVHPGPHEQASVFLDEQVIRGILTGLPDGVPQAVRLDPVDSAPGGAPGSATPLSRWRAGARATLIPYDHAGNLGCHRGGRRLRRVCRRRLGRTIGITPRCSADGYGVDAPIGRHPHAVYLAIGGVEQDKGLAAGIDPEDATGRFRSRDHVSFRGDGKRDHVRRGRAVERRRLAVWRNPVDHPPITRGGKEVAGLIGGKRPDVAVFRIEEHPRLSVRVDDVDLAVGRGADVHATFRRRSQGMCFELRRVEEGRDGAVAGNFQDLSLVAAAGQDGTVGRRNDRPEKGSGRLTHERSRRPEKDAAIDVD